MKSKRTRGNRRSRRPDPTSRMSGNGKRKKNTNGRSGFGRGFGSSSGVGSKSGLGGILSALANGDLKGVLDIIIDAPAGSSFDLEQESRVKTKWDEKSRQTNQGSMISATSELHSTGELEAEKTSRGFFQRLFGDSSEG